MRIAIVAVSLAMLAVPSLAQDGSARADIKDVEGKSLGILTLSPMEGGVHIHGDLNNLPPGLHGIHIHETGTCDAAANFESAGAHFEPGDHKHGSENPDGPHAGDLPNIGDAAAGVLVTVDLMNETVTLGEGEANLLDADGSAIVIHAGPDDYNTDPAGNSGDRIACGMIEAGS